MISAKGTKVINATSLVITIAVSYTHLDVYKRQEVVGVVSNMIDGINEEKTGASNAEESFESIEDLSLIHI